MVLKVQPVGRQRLGRKSAALWITAAVLWLSLGCAGWMTCLESFRWLQCIPLQLVLAALAVEMSVAHMLKLHLSSVTVSAAVAAWADDHILMPGF